MISETNLNTSILHTNPQSGQTPIYRKIEVLLSRADLSDRDRHYLLWLKCRDDDLIKADELVALQLIWELHQPREAIA